MLWYIEHKSGQNHRGSAWIGRIQRSRTGQTVYFNGRALKSLRGSGFSANYRDLESGDEYWVSGIKRRGRDRHSLGSGRVMIDATIVEEYLEWTGASALDLSRFVIVPAIPPTDPQRFKEIENRRD